METNANRPPHRGRKGRVTIALHGYDPRYVASCVEITPCWAARPARPHACCAPDAFHGMPARWCAQPCWGSSQAVHASPRFWATRTTRPSRYPRLRGDHALRSGRLHRRPADQRRHRRERTHPRNYDATRAHPLLVVLAPAGYDRHRSERYAGLTTSATSVGFVVAMPTTSRSPWPPFRSWVKFRNWFPHAGALTPPG